MNNAAAGIADDIQVAAYAVTDGRSRLVATLDVPGPLLGARTSRPFVVELSVSDLADADAIRLVVDDDGSGLGTHFECDATDNAAPFCPGAPAAAR